MKDLQCYSVGYGNANDCALSASEFTDKGLMFLVGFVVIGVMFTLFCQWLGK